MNVKPGDTLVKDFTISNPTTGAAVDADSTPSVALVIDGVDNAASVTVTNKATGSYKASVTIPSGTADRATLELRASAAVGGVTGKQVIWTGQAERPVSILGSVNDASATTTSFKGDSALSSTDNLYQYSALVFTSGALTGLKREIASYTGSTRTLNFSTAFPAAPANGDRFEIIGGSK